MSKTHIHSVYWKAYFLWEDILPLGNPFFFLTPREYSFEEIYIVTFESIPSLV